MKLSGRRILLVEDDVSLARMLERLLLMEDAHVSHVADGQSALGALGTGARFDLLIVDLLLPDMSGWDVLDGLAALGSGQPRPVVIVLTASGDPEEPRRALLRGVRYLPKPFTAAALMDLAIDQPDASEVDDA